MSKRVIESSSSSGSDDCTTCSSSRSSSSATSRDSSCPSEGNIVKSSQSHLSNEKGSPKKARNDSPVSEQRSSTHNGAGIIFKREPEILRIDSRPDTMNVACSSSAVIQLSQSELQLSTVERALSMIHQISKERKQPSPPKKVPGPKRHEKYFEGYLVMGRIARGCPLWPGMIRKAGPANFRNHGYTKFLRGKVKFCVRFFQSPSTLRWMSSRMLRMFDAAKPNQCKHGISTVVVEFEKGIKIAKAAANVSVEARLAKFTLFQGQSIDGLLAEIDNVNPKPNTNASIPIQPPVLRNDLHVQEKVVTAPTTQENGESNTDSVTQKDVGFAHPAIRNEEICHDSVENYKKRIAEFRQKLQEKCNRERDEEIIKKEGQHAQGLPTAKILTTEESKLENEKHELEATVQKQVKMIVGLQENLEKEKLEHNKELEKEKQEKQKYKEESEKLKAVLEEMLLG